MAAWIAGLSATGPAGAVSSARSSKAARANGGAGEGAPALVGEGDEAERVARVEPVDERLERRARRRHAVAGVHRAAAVEDDLDRGGWTARGGRQLGRGELEHDRDLVGLFDGDEVDVQVSVDVHGGGSLGGSGI